MFDPEITAVTPTTTNPLDLDPLLNALQSFAGWNPSAATEDELLGLAPQTEQLRRLLDSFSCHLLAELEYRLR